MLTLAQMKAHVRYLVDDVDSVLSGDNELETLINEAGTFFFTLYTSRAARGVGIASGDAVASQEFFKITSGGGFFDTNSNAMAKLLTLSLEAPGILAATDYQDGPPLERVSVEQIYLMRKTLGTTSGVPKRWAAWRKSLGTDATQGVWRVLLYPPSSSTNYTVSGRVELEWVDLTNDAQVPNVSFEEAHAICRLAAIQCARLLGRTRLQIQAMRNLLPNHVKAAMGIIERQLAPREPRESPA